jgi:hypothetical protein
MTGQKDSGLQEQVEKALLPLTSGGEFRLETIKYDIHFGVFEFRLHSEKIDIIFRNKLIFRTESQVFTTQNVEFFLPSVRKTFSGEFLFPAMNINILFRHESPLRGIREGLHVPGTSRARPQVILLLEDSSVMSNFYELSMAISRHISTLHAWFHPDALDETIRLYESEIEKKKNPVSRYDLSEFLRYTRRYDS